MNYKGYCQTIMLLSLFLLSVFGVAQATDERFSQATTAYNNGQYQLAIENFESLTRDGLSSNLLYNLANSYAQNGQTGMAVLNYERAARLAPGDSDIQGNLELLRKEKTLFQEEQTISQRFVRLLGLDSWTILTMVGFVLFVTCLLFPVTPRLKANTRRFVAAVSVLLVVASALGIAGEYRHYHDAVVIVSDAKLRISPFEAAAASGSIQEGRLLTPVKSHNNYTLVKDETGRSGWLASDEFMFIAHRPIF
jgi:tetratricopeptide (TPR) repeat protein